ncbi:hypoxia/intracellular survival transcriptional regulator MosR [Mycolicibacterium gilvum]|uniref:hypoxia/intracellular survival transcriptional regulator MosR n=1 Tax=Mycolicibacterium gilvum TaxID=1804 RepID=UPI004045D5D6
MTSFANPRLRDDTTSGTGDYRLGKLPESTASSLCDVLDVGYRSASDLKDQFRKRRQAQHLLKLDEKTTERARSAPPQVLEQLADFGFAWRDIARVIGVSVPAITKWRKGAGVTGQNRLKIARLLALTDMLSERFIDEPASWLEVPIADGVALTGMDVLERGRYELVLDLASPHTGDGTTEYVLNEIDPNWRDSLADNTFESFVADDGVVSLRLKG